MAEETEGSGVAKKVSRREFMKTVAAGAAAAGIAAAAPSMLAGSAEAAPSASELAVLAQVSPGTPIVAYVRDLSKGEVVIMAGTKETVRRDAALAARLAASTVG